MKIEIEDRTMNIRLTNVICFLVVVCFAGCHTYSEEDTGRVPFTINPLGRHLDIPVLLEDSIATNLMFDTGAQVAGYFLELDSTLCVEHSSIVGDLCAEDTIMTGVAWTPSRTPGIVYNKKLKTSLGNHSFTYTGMIVSDLKTYMGEKNYEGIFNIPATDTTHVWELNFEHNYLKIHSGDEFIMPDNCFVTPLIKAVYPFYFRLPLKIQTASGDTLTMNHVYMIDTGMSDDICLMRHAEEFPFFDKQKDAVWLQTAYKYTRYYTVQGKLFNQMALDSLRIYTIGHKNDVKSEYLVGLNFLKRFNVFFDMKNQQIGLQPIANFQRVVNPVRKRFHISFEPTQSGRILVSKVADYKGNYYQAAGFQEGDEVISVNGKIFNKLTSGDEKELSEQDTLYYDILRNGQQLKLTVHVDRNEEQGD